MIALTLAVFAILFGTRGIDATEHHPGMVVAIAAESLFKLVALLLVAHLPDDARRRQAIADYDAAVARRLAAAVDFLRAGRDRHVRVLLSSTDVHIGVVECADVADVRRARWWFGGYLVLLSIVVIPIVAASMPLDAAGRGAPSTDRGCCGCRFRPARNGWRCWPISADFRRPPAW